MTVIEYITEEVTRQGHIVTQLDGIERVGWMLDGWSYAMWRSGAKIPWPSIDDLENIGRRVERLRNINGFRRVNVRVGRQPCPDWERVPNLLSELFSQIQAHTPLEFYKALMGIHPFADGNGRSGKIILNWLAGTLDKPWFPPNDLFGTWIINP